MPSPDTSAQEPVASQEAEARDFVFRLRPVGGPAFIDALDAYVAYIRASERERYPKVPAFWNGERWQTMFVDGRWVPYSAALEEAGSELA